ncbi:MAG: hypothetical protein BroJett024_11370 [Alphaproteobacteria bacterium]|nr:MAG: hypothetical protein BroJett024_11370 [Alphaproteobacteria bacterium]
MQIRILAVLAAAAAVLFAAGASAQSVSGRYQVVGTNFNGSPYAGTAEIFQTSSTTCRMTWRTGSTTSRGICMRNASTFVAAYSMGRGYGLVVYEIKPDGALEGTWTAADREGLGTERLIPLR